MHFSFCLPVYVHYIFGLYFFSPPQTDEQTWQLPW